MSLIKDARRDTYNPSYRFAKGRQELHIRVFPIQERSSVTVFAQYTCAVMLPHDASDQVAKAQEFRELHQRDNAFIIPNPWDVGTARLLTHLGFEALATTSMGYAFSCGRKDNTLSREETLAYAAEIVGASPLPVSADLENGFGDSPQSAAETIRLAGAANDATDYFQIPTGRVVEVGTQVTI